MTTGSLFAIVLAAGASSRFGSTKQLADYRGEPLVRHAVRAAETCCGSRTVLVTGNEWQRVHDACAPLQGFLVRNERYGHGLSTSIACAVQAVRDTASAVLLLLADQPLVTPAHLRALIAAWNGSATDIVCSGYAGTFGPPVIFPAACFDEMLELRGDQGARVILERHAARVARVPFEEAATDVDVPEDLARLEAPERPQG